MSFGIFLQISLFCIVCRKEFQEHKIHHLVTIKQRDVLKEGFQLNNVADAGKADDGNLLK